MQSNPVKPKVDILKLLTAFLGAVVIGQFIALFLWQTVTDQFGRVWLENRVLGILSRDDAQDASGPSGSLGPVRALKAGQGSHSFRNASATQVNTTTGTVPPENRVLGVLTRDDSQSSSGSPGSLGQERAVLELSQAWHRTRHSFRNPSVTQFNTTSIPAAPIVAFCLGHMSKGYRVVQADKASAQVCFSGTGGWAHEVSFQTLLPLQDLEGNTVCPPGGSGSPVCAGRDWKNKIHVLQPALNCDDTQHNIKHTHAFCPLGTGSLRICIGRSASKQLAPSNMIIRYVASSESCESHDGYTHEFDFVTERSADEGGVHSRQDKLAKYSAVRKRLLEDGNWSPGDSRLTYGDFEGTVLKELDALYPANAFNPLPNCVVHSLDARITMLKRLKNMRLRQLLQEGLYADLQTRLLRTKLVARSVTCPTQAASTDVSDRYNERFGKHGELCEIGASGWVWNTYPATLCKVKSVGVLLGYQPGESVFDWGAGCGWQLQWASAAFGTVPFGHELATGAAHYMQNTSAVIACSGDGSDLGYLTSLLRSTTQAQPYLDHVIANGAIVHLSEDSQCKVLQQLIEIVRPHGGTIWVGWQGGYVGNPGSFKWLPDCLVRGGLSSTIVWEEVNEKAFFGGAEYDSDDSKSLMVYKL